MCGGRMCGPDPGPGCSGTCGSCPRGFACNSVGTACVLDPTSYWIVRATTGTVASTAPGGGAWDADGSAPDPYVCLTLAGVETCTPYAADTFTPRWDFDFPAVTAASLMAGVPNYYADDDWRPDDYICSMGTVMFTAANLTAGTRTLSCLPNGTFTLTFRAR